MTFFLFKKQRERELLGANFTWESIQDFESPADQGRAEASLWGRGLCCLIHSKVVGVGVEGEAVVPVQRKGGNALF